MQVQDVAGDLPELAELAEWVAGAGARSEVSEQSMASLTQAAPAEHTDPSGPVDREGDYAPRLASTMIGPRGIRSLGLFYGS